MTSHILEQTKDNFRMAFTDLRNQSFTTELKRQRLYLYIKMENIKTLRIIGRIRFIPLLKKYMRI